VPLPFPSILELLTGFSEAESGWFHSLCIVRRFLRDAEVFRQGDPPDGICIVKKGLLKIVSISEKGTEQILHILRPGDVLPWARRGIVGRGRSRAGKDRYGWGHGRGPARLPLVIIHLWNDGVSRSPLPCPHRVFFPME
jgi:hypothetical protein